MAAHTTHKNTAQGKAQTLARRTARANKAGAVRVNRSGRIVK